LNNNINDIIEKNNIYIYEIPPKPFTIGELRNIITAMKPNKAPGYDLITGRTLKELPKEGLCYLTQLNNAILRTHDFPIQWKVAQITMIPKPGKPIEEVKSYRPISLLPIASKLIETLILKRIMPIIEEKNIIPKHQFGFRKKHSTVDQVHRLVKKINSELEVKHTAQQYIFLDVSQAFDKVWHVGLLYKLKTNLLFYFQVTNIYLMLED